MKKFLIVLCLAAVLITGGAHLSAANASPKIDTAETQMLERLAVTVMQPAIKSAVNTFYAQYFNQLPDIRIQDTKIADITAYNGAVFFDVTAETKPVIAENISIGQDKISLFVDVCGIVTAEKFEHQRNFELPQNYQDRIIKPLPENTVTKLAERTRAGLNNEAIPDNKMTHAEKLDALVRVLVIMEVQNAVRVFYIPYLKSPPQMNAYFGYEIVKLSKMKDYPGFTLIITITPYMGAHNPIGKEKITMEIWKNGAAFVTDYEHLESYGIVPWLKDSLKKPLPKGTQKEKMP